MDKIWWNQVIRAREFVDTIAENALDYNKSTVLVLPKTVPWAGSLKDIVNDRAISYSGGGFDFISDPDADTSVNDYMLERFCKSETRALIRYGESTAKFLAKCDGTTLNNSYVWVECGSKERAQEWISFVSEYTGAISENVRAGVFIIQIDDSFDTKKAAKGVERLSFDDCISRYDAYAFCIMASSAAIKSRPAFRSYLAELSSIVCGTDVELCAECIQRGEQFISDPVKTLEAIAGESQRANGEPFEVDFNSGAIEEKAWECHLRTVFPIVELYRKQFIEKHKKDIQNNLPIKRSDGTMVNNPYEVELGQIFYLMGVGKINVPNKSERDELTCFKDARNSLAHLSPVDFKDVEKIMNSKI